MYYHEKYDGSGYPHAIKGEDIPKIARIFSIVDVFDAKLLEKFFEISQTLHNEVIQKSQTQLRKELDSLIYHYFLDDKLGYFWEEDNKKNYVIFSHQTIMHRVKMRHLQKFSEIEIKCKD